MSIIYYKLLTYNLKVLNYSEGLVGIENYALFIYLFPLKTKF